MQTNPIYLGAFAGAAACLFLLSLLLARLTREKRFLLVNLAVAGFGCFFLADRPALQASLGLSDVKTWMLTVVSPMFVSLVALCVVLQTVMNTSESKPNVNGLLKFVAVLLGCGAFAFGSSIIAFKFGPPGMDMLIEQSLVPNGFFALCGVTALVWLVGVMITPVQLGEWRAATFGAVLATVAFVVEYSLVLRGTVRVTEATTNQMRIESFLALALFTLAMHRRAQFRGQQQAREVQSSRSKHNEWQEKQASHQAISQAHLMQVLKREKELEAELRAREQEQMEALKAAKEAADETARNKAQFLAFMSHEIRTPLNGIMGMVHLLMNTDMSEQQRDYLQTLNYSGDALLALVNDTLDISKIEAGQLTLESIDFDLQRLVSSIIMLMSARASEKNLLIRSDIGQSVPRFIKGDPTRLRQIFLNLINNAIKFTEEGGVTVKARRVDGAPEGSTRLRLDIQDTGPGISEEGRQRLFKEYSQVDSSTARLHGGTGLGLSICKQLVQAMNGEIGVDSVVGEGSSFWFTVDFLNTTEDAMGEMAGKAPGTPILSAMVIEDNDIHQKVIGGYLRLDRHKVTLVGSAEEALEKLSQADFDVLLMDVNLPGIDGNEATRRIRSLANPMKRGVPIIAITGNTAPADIDECRQAGMDDFVGKPVDPDALRATVFATHKAWLARRSMEGAGHIPAPRPASASSMDAKGERLRVLIVDDNQINQKVMAGFLKVAGHEIAFAGTGEKGVQMAQENPYDVVFMDVTLPGIDGLEATRRIRALPDGRASTVPIMAITGNTSEEDRQACLNAGMTDFLGKPIDPTTLDAAIARVRQKTKAGYDDLDDYLPPEPTEAAMLDEAVLGRLTKAFSLSALSGLMNEMMSETRPIISGMHDSIAQEDLKALRAHAHTLKGMAMTLGVVGVGELSADIESSIQRGANQATLAEMVDRLEGVFQMSCSAIERWQGANSVAG